MKRAQILERDKGECQWCHRIPLKPIVHHKVYIMRRGVYIKPWEYDDKYLITLCPKCHEWWHQTHKNKVLFK